ncbi:hypothetical protein M9Y10_011732 [Tritrichomonas musculus]|uniref:Phospholipid-transporting ATPase n=1 Tax=Tritrichomonas musculus TaxID=1915356 RepID=A0ABR2IMF6_9EUKA
MSSQDSGRTVIVHKTRDDKGKRLFVDNKISTTKYNFLTFIPLNLFFQFTRIANFYFLIIVLLLQFSWAPISASVAVVPLVIVIGFTMVRDGVEDLLRWKSDKKINNSTAHYLRNGQFEDIAWKDISVGDVIQIKKDEQVPADIVLLSSSNDDGITYIDTCNLDGETNLKIRQALVPTQYLTTAPKCSEFNATIVCDQPNNLLYTFNGYIKIGAEQHSLENRQILLRGCVLRNTHWANGVVVYTGKESKIMMNSSKSRTKRSLLERGLNWKLGSVFIFMLAFSFIGAGVGFVFEKKQINSGNHWYFRRNQNNKRNLAGMFFILLVSHIVIINAIIPISLYVTLEVVRIFQALFVKWDVEMYDEDTQTFANARTSNISDDLGQIEYIFSDKTGTLTCNKMEFMKCSIAGKIYGSGTTEVAYAAAKRKGIKIDPPDFKGKAFKDEDFMEIINGKKSDIPIEIRHFLWTLSICHAVIPEEDETQPYGIQFQASSPDEGALVLAAADFGYIFTSRSSAGITLKVDGEIVNVEVLANLEFSSERKRSSVIIKHPETNEIILYCKGADDLIFQRLSKDSPYQEETRKNLEEFAANGLRTLCCAYRVLDPDFFNGWIERYRDANCSITDRESAVNEVANEVESELTLIGATAIEDKLQQGVPDTIECLLKAKINLWVITGDKRETAINIGFACSLLSPKMKLVELDIDDEEKLMKIVNENLNNEDDKQPLALVASGSSLYHLLNDENSDTFYRLSQKCQSVICCRVSPLQKATIVKIMREKTGSLALAIGDGANDVGMILQADVGVGISGLEGTQAVLSSDYSISQFRFLKRLLLVHGYLNFYRNVDLVNYSFYKNMAFSFNQIIYGFLTSNGGATMYESVLYTVFNVIFTSIPPIVYAAADRDVTLEAMMNSPEIFHCDGKKKWMISYWRFWVNLLLGMYHGVCAFIVPYFALPPFIYSNGRTFGLREFGTIVYASVVAIVNARIMLMSHNWTWLHHLFFWLSILIFPVVALVIDAIQLSDDFRGVMIPLLRSGLFYMPIIGSIILALIPILLYYTIENSLDNIRNMVNYMEKNRKVSNAFLEQASSDYEDERLASDSGGRSLNELDDDVVLTDKNDVEIDNNYDEGSDTQKKGCKDDHNRTGYAFDVPSPLAAGENKNEDANNADNENESKIMIQQEVSKKGLDDL